MSAKVTPEDIDEARELWNASHGTIVNASTGSTNRRAAGIDRIAAALATARANGVLHAAAAFFGRAPEHHVTILALLGVDDHE